MFFKGFQNVFKEISAGFWKAADGFDGFKAFIAAQDGLRRFRGLGSEGLSGVSGGFSTVSNDFRNVTGEFQHDFGDFRGFEVGLDGFQGVLGI